MTRALFIGQQPETVDFSDPAIPPGFNAEKIHAGIAIAMAKMAERGWHADLCLIPPGEKGSQLVQKQLAAASYDCVVIGAGIRLPPKSLCSRPSLTQSIRPRPVRPLHSTRDQRTRRRRLLAGCNLTK